MNQLQMLKQAMIAYVNSAKAIWSAIAHPLSIISKKATMLKDYRIYGNSVQDGEPTPENPIEVQSVGELTTKNIFNIDACLNECLTKNDDGTYTFKKTESNQFTNWATVYIPIDTKYAKGFDVVEKNRPSYSNDAIGVQYKYEDGTEGAGVLYANNIGTATGSHHVSTVPKNVVAVRFYMVHTESVGDYITFKNVQFEFGEESTEYEPYHKYKVPVTVRGKNLFDQNIWSDLFDLTEGGYYQSNTIIKVDNSEREFYLEAGDYNLSYACKCPIGKNYRLGFRYEDGTKLNLYFTSTGEWIERSQKITLPQRVVSVMWYYGSQSDSVCFKDIQIELGDTATSFEPYIEPQTHNIYLDEPLRKIGDYVDSIDFNKGVVVRNVEQKIYTGEEKWTEHGTKNLLNQYNATDIVASTSKIICTSSNRIVGIMWNTLYYNMNRADGEFIVGVAASGSVADKMRYIFVCPYSSAISPEEWKAQLTEWYAEGNPFTVLYIKTTTEEEINLPKLPQFKGTTVYEVQQDIPPSGIEVCYYE